MKSKYIEESINYTGKELRSHYIYSQVGIQGDAIVAFCGTCDIAPDAMVDVEDVLANSIIHSDYMLHFIVEHYDPDLEKAILRQLLLASIVHDHLIRTLDSSTVIRRGTDLFDGDAKLSISVATVSPVSLLVHFGINISSAHTPVKTRGLSDYNIEPRAFALRVMEQYVQEHNNIGTARSKVRWVT